MATVSEIAYRVGFNDPSSFTKLFKKKFGISPGNVIKDGVPPSDDDQAEKAKAASSRKFKRIYRIALAAVIILLVVILGVRIVNGINEDAEKSIAVLPLQNLTGQPENAYFVDGMHDALIGELGKIESVRVISRTSTLRYQKSDMLLKDIAHELGVNTIVEGSVQCFDDSLCFIVQVIDVYPKERHLLAGEYYDDLENVLNVQSRVVKDIAQHIQVKLTKEQEEKLMSHRPVDPETYKDNLRGMYHINQGTVESFETGMTFLHRAMDRDPGDPFAYAGLALGYAHLGHGIIFSKDAFQTAQAAARKAINIDPDLDEAHLALAMLNLYNFFNWPAAKAEFEETLARNPNNEIAHAHYAWYYVLYHNKERSLYHGRQATIIEPLSAAYHSWLGWLEVYYDELDAAEASARRSLELVENLPYGNVVLGYVYLKRKEYEKAVETHEKLPMVHPFFKMVLANSYVQAGYREKAMKLREEVEQEAMEHWVNPYERGCLAGILGDMDEAFRLLDEAREDKLYPTNHLDIVIPGADFLRDDPRYREFFHKMGLKVYPEEILAEKQ